MRGGLGRSGDIPGKDGTSRDGGVSIADFVRSGYPTAALFTKAMLILLPQSRPPVFRLSATRKHRQGRRKSGTRMIGFRDRLRTELGSACRFASQLPRREHPRAKASEHHHANRLRNGFRPGTCLLRSSICHRSSKAPLQAVDRTGNRATLANFTRVTGSTKQERLFS